MNELHDICPQTPTQKAIHDLVRAMDKELVDTVREKGVEWVIAALRAQQSGGWISVEEQLPTSKDAIKTGDIMACDGWGDYYFIHWHDFRVRVNEFTHWQPLPPEPKEG